MRKNVGFYDWVPAFESKRQRDPFDCQQKHKLIMIVHQLSPYIMINNSRVDPDWSEPGLTTT